MCVICLFPFSCLLPSAVVFPKKKSRFFCFYSFLGKTTGGFKVNVHVFFLFFSLYF